MNSSEARTIISKPNNLENFKQSIKKDGLNSFYILADFDRTLTRAYFEDEFIPSVISILRNGGFLTQKYADQAHALFNKYHPIEIDPKIPEPDKKQAMYEWWITHFDLLIDSGLNKKDIAEVIKSSKIQLRHGSQTFFQFLHAQNIPLIILSSAGLGTESISLFLEKEGVLTSNIHIISNSFEWNDNGFAEQIREPIIHTLNKNETHLEEMPFYDQISTRRNVLLVGDSLSDNKMIEGQDHDNILKISFYNEKTPTHLNDYQEIFDVVITGDGPLDFLNDLLQEFDK